MSATAGGRPVGPVVPTATSRVTHRGLGLDDVRIDGGPWGRWQSVNRAVSIPLGIKQLRKAGNLDNLRLAAGEATGEFRGPRFMDSDLYKQLEAVAWETGRESDKDLHEFIRESAELLSRAQREDGYLNSYYQFVKPDQQYAELEYSHEMYCAGHLIQAAVASARVGGAPKLLEVARRFADHLVKVFLHEGNSGIDGHPEIETALVELYRLTGEESYLRLAEKLINERGKGHIANSGMGAHYLQDHLPVREVDTHVGHAVRALYLEAGIVDVYLETGDESLLEWSVRRWEDMVASKTYLTGGVGSRHSHEAFGDRYELPPDRAYTETCAAIASIHWSWRLLLATGQRRYADLIERTLYNGFAASTSTDGTKFFYVNPLQRRFDHIEGDDPGRRHEWFSCACCPPNIMRLVSSLGHYVASTSDDELAVHQFAPGTIRADLPAGEVALSVETDYPWAGAINLTVDRGPGSEWTLAIRVPSWSESATVTVNGEPVAATPGERGYLSLRRAWQPGDTMTIELDMTPRLVFPHQSIDAVRGSTAVERGPLVYCFEQVDQAEGADVGDLALAPDAALRVKDTELPGVGRTVAIEASAFVVSQPSDGLPYSTKRPEELVTVTPTTATAVPYFQWDNRDGSAMRVWTPLHLENGS
ncbi:glycoside hydrolase family 127 protein [Actinopolymorpha alba]|uniref:glycoside hydrolase family 127 protein n=1 Tax=Actinopolymorpha alba TaxID=533267 RepID=UPI000476019B|nr:beta-L-arabinofuranosidase domain-containing protein [Actinopolymorpha alba]